MAIDWLDAARYGDTSVYHADGPRDMWAWRDAIVDAFNLNMPFDEFSINQLAGDLIPNANDQQQLLAGFNRNNGTTDEGGAIAEEYRVEYVVDRVKTTSTVWLGLTMNVANAMTTNTILSAKKITIASTLFSIPAVMEACKHGEAMQHRYFKLRTLLKKSNYFEKQQALTETKQAIERIENANVEQLTNWLAQQSDNPDQKPNLSR